MGSDDNLKSRIKPLGGQQPSYQSQSVLYVMSRDIRVQDNHALLAAQKHALAKQLPLIVAYVLYDKPLPNRAREHINFLLDGLADVRRSLEQLDISFVLLTGSVPEKTAELARECKSDAVYLDFSPLRHARLHRKELAELLSCKLYEVDTHNLVPVWVTSDKQEIAARTIRSKIHRNLAAYTVEPASIQRHPYTVRIKVEQADEDAIGAIVRAYPTNGSDITRFVSGEHAAHKALERFIEARFEKLGTDRSDPTRDAQTELSPYLHFGMLSSLRVVLRVLSVLSDHDLQATAFMNDRMPRPTDDKPLLQRSADVLIEEMIVRKELSDNFCYYNHQYDAIAGAPEWAQRTLSKHASDPREFVYSYEQLEQAQTHDPAWNAAQRQLTGTGKMHNYMRMYWAKKILEWTESPEQALEYAIKLNDFYSLDGGDPNGYVGIMWSIAGVHDRPWGERSVYGVVRSMVYDGLKRKFDIKSYEQKY